MERHVTSQTIQYWKICCWQQFNGAHFPRGLALPVSEIWHLQESQGDYTWLVITKGDGGSTGISTNYYYAMGAKKVQKIYFDCADYSLLKNKGEKRGLPTAEPIKTFMNWSTLTKKDTACGLHFNLPKHIFKPIQTPAKRAIMPSCIFDMTQWSFHQATIWTWV